MLRVLCRYKGARSLWYSDLFEEKNQERKCKGKKEN